MSRLLAILRRTRPCGHAWTGLREIGMTNDCDYGCKIMACPCGVHLVSHRAIYGCPQG